MASGHHFSVSTTDTWRVRIASQIGATTSGFERVTAIARPWSSCVERDNTGNLQFCFISSAVGWIQSKRRKTLKWPGPVWNEVVKEWKKPHLCLCVVNFARDGTLLHHPFEIQLQGKTYGKKPEWIDYSKVERKSVAVLSNNVFHQGASRYRDVTILRKR